MTLLIYSTNAEGAGERLQRAIELLITKDRYEMYRTIGDLLKRLRQPLFNPTIAVLLACSREDLQNFLSIRDLLKDIKIILILPDNAPDTVAQGHMLRPRFLSYCDGDFVDVAAVLSLMIRNLEAYRSLDINT